MITLHVHTDDLNDILNIVNLVSNYIYVKRSNELGASDTWVVSYQPIETNATAERVPVLVKTK